MKTSQWEIENYRREVFHLLDKHFAENEVLLFRTDHFIERLNLRSTNPIGAVRAFITAAKRAMTIPINKKTSILIDDFVFLFRMDENLRNNQPHKKILMCVTFGQNPHHFSDADLKLTFKKKT